MADIYGSHFEYAGISSRRYGLIIANVETERNTSISGSIDGISMINKKSKQRYLVDDDYSDFPVAYEVDIVTDTDKGIEFNERREIEKWLFNKHNYSKLYIDITDDTFGETYEVIDGLQKQLYMNCRFINPERIEYNGGIVGYRVTLESDSGMWWQDAVTKTFDLNNDTASGTSIISVNVDTDIDDYTYPTVSFTMGDIGGDVIITNHSDDSTRLTKFVGLSPFATVTMRSELNYVNGQYYEKFAYRNFIRLLDGTNNLSIIGDVKSITVEYQNRRLF